ncbi:MAG: dynamin family protein [Chitinispirillaceae bacterium]|nr:dynamin family protein [Chitinispirillaceae bacterium]
MHLFTLQRGNFAQLNTATRPVVDALVSSSDGEPRSIDELINAALIACENLPDTFRSHVEQIRELHSRLAYGRLHLAVIGEFNRGKSTFINALVGERLLPTSVLPITTVPTRIIYGQQLSCTIRFLNDKPPLSIRASTAEINGVLHKYVAEQNNPKNQYCVASVEVTVPSPLLENGTVLIDTPGFGSTYLHNTQTALEALTNCDAALFLLSADPPMTQTEVEFFKQVLHHVPRLFFILNKVDLLTSSQLRQVDEFISGILTTHLPPAEPPRIFHVCARKAETAQDQSLADILWSTSGMETVKVDILDFMAREKYFTLSQAINDRLRETIAAIVTLLEKEKGEYEAPLTLLNREREEVAAELEAIRKTIDTEQTVLAAEKKAVLKFLDEQFSSGKPLLVRKVREALGILLDGVSCSGESLRGVSVALNKVMAEALSAFRTRLLAQVNRPLKKAVLLHQKSYTDAVAAVAVCLDGKKISEGTVYHEKFEALELDIDPSQDQTDERSPLTLTTHWHEFFLGRERKLQRLHQRYDHVLEEQLQEQLFAFSRQARQRVEALFSTLEELLSEQYHQLSGRLEQVLERKESKVQQTLSQINRTTTAFATKIDEFRKIASHLY